MGVDRQTFGYFKVEENVFGRGTFLHCIPRPINPLAACSHMHTWPVISDPREVHWEREDTVWEQASHQ